MPDALKKEIPLLTAINRGISCTLSILLSFDKGSEYTETSGTRFIKIIVKTSEGFDYDFDNAFFDSNYSKKILPFYYHYQKIKAGNLLK